MSTPVRATVIAVMVVAAVFILWFGARNARKVEVKRYPMNGTVVAVHLQNGTATVHNDNIPGFMQPMDMDYKIADPAALSKLKAGNRISATLESDGQGFRLEAISILAAPGAP